MKTIADQREGDAIRLEAGDRRGDGEDAGRRRDRDRQHVVDEQGGRGDERRELPEVLLGDDVGAAGLLVRADGLAVEATTIAIRTRDRDRDRQTSVQRAGETPTRTTIAASVA